MHTQTLNLYREARKDGWRAQAALCRARVLREWKQRDCGQWDTPDGDAFSVRLRIAEDYLSDADYLVGDGATERQRKDTLERANRDGVWGIVGEYWNGAEWVEVDACWGFVGDDWKGSGYDTDVMAETLTARREFYNAMLLQGGV